MHEEMTEADFEEMMIERERVWLIHGDKLDPRFEAEQPAPVGMEE